VKTLVSFCFTLAQQVAIGQDELMKPKLTYAVDRALHWTSALAILLMLWDMGTRIHFVDYEIKGIVQHKQDAIEFHMTVAVIMLVSLAARFIWSRWFLHDSYQLTYTSNKHKWLVLTVHYSLYLILALLVVTGILMITNYEHVLSFYQLISFSENNVNRPLFYDANDWHIQLQNIIYLFLCLHIAGAIYNKR